MEQLKPGLIRKIGWDKYQSKVSTHAQNYYLDYLIDLSVQGVNRLFVLSFEDNAVRTGFFFQG